MEARTFKKNNYIHVPGFAIVELQLSGNELLCYSLIYGFSQDEESEFNGSLTYVASALNVTKQNAKRVIDRLIEKGLIEKREIFFSGVKFCKYVANRCPEVETDMPLSKQQRPVAETATPLVIKSATNNNIIINNNRDNIPADGGLFEDQADFKPVVVTAPKNGKRRKKEYVSFEQTKYFGNPECFCRELAETGEFPANTDYMSYYYAAIDWSKQGNVYAQWVAAVRGWMRKDMQKGKLSLIKQNGLSPDEIDYLKEMADLDNPPVWEN